MKQFKNKKTKVNMAAFHYPVDSRSFSYASDVPEVREVLAWYDNDSFADDSGDVDPELDFLDDSLYNEE